MTIAEMLLVFSAVSTQYNIPPGLLKAVCEHESGLRNIVVPRDGKGPSYGVCQIKPVAAKQVRFTSANLMNPRDNIKVAGAYLAYQKKRYGTWSQALVAYNRGSSSGLKTNKYFRAVFEKWAVDTTQQSR